MLPMWEKQIFYQKNSFTISSWRFMMYQTWWYGTLIYSDSCGVQKAILIPLKTFLFGNNSKLKVARIIQRTLEYFVWTHHQLLTFCHICVTIIFLVLTFHTHIVPLNYWRVTCRHCDTTPKYKYFSVFSRNKHILLNTPSNELRRLTIYTIICNVWFIFKFHQLSQ